MEPLQVIMFESAMGAQRRLLESALPQAPQVPYQPTRREAAVAQGGQTTRTWVAGFLRRTADRVDPCPAPSAG
jgi:hypothetical protein